MSEPWIVMVGCWHSGYTCYGPFDEKDAEDFGEQCIEQGHYTCVFPVVAIDVERKPRLEVVN